MINFLIYLDPGSGSYLVQALVAAVLGVAFFFKNISLMLKAWYYRLFKRSKEK
jgi:hypothetical protein